MKHAAARLVAERSPAATETIRSLFDGEPPFDAGALLDRLVARLHGEPPEAGPPLDSLASCPPPLCLAIFDALRGVYGTSPPGGGQEVASRLCQAIDAELLLTLELRDRAREGRIEALEQANAELTEMASRYRTIFAEAPISIVVVDGAGVIRDVNAWHLEMLGRPGEADQVIGQSLYELPVTESLDLSGTIDALLGGATVERHQLPHTPPALGKQLLLNVRGIPLVREQCVTGAILLIEDVSEQARLGEQLVRAQKMESLGTLAGGIAHEFNNLLSGILGHASMLHAKIPAGDPLLRYATKVEESARRAAELTQQLLTFSRDTEVERRLLDAGQVVRELGRLLERSMPPRIRVGVECPEEHAVVEADPTQLQQAILNLCVNARDAMPNGGDLRLRVDVTPVVPPAGAAGHGCEADYVRIQVVDSGTGMDAQTVNRVFDPFFTTKPPGKGTGLGLAIAYRIAETHGGFVDLRSELGVGTTVELLLPRQLGLPADVPTALPAPPHGRGTILVVDDEPVLLELVGELLGELGYEILMAEDGLEALDIYEMRWGGIDLVLLDVVMPRMGGRETLNALRSINPSVKVIVCSGYLHETDVDGLSLRGVQGFLRKPYDRDKLTRAVWQALADGNGP